MSSRLHRIYVILLFAVGITTVLVVAGSGYRYYSTPPVERGNNIADYEAKISGLEVERELMSEGFGSMGLTEEDLDEEKVKLERQASYWRGWGASGMYGHGLGILGSLMMISGVALYSTRKRVRRFRFTGKIKHFLEFHIFLCLLGPALVMLHSTFKFGGIVSLSLWSMVFVALSGIFGRYLYSQLPKTTDGEELSLEQLTRENEILRMQLKIRYHLSDELLSEMDEVSTVRYDVRQQAVFGLLFNLFRDAFSRPRRIRRVRLRLRNEDIPDQQIRHVLGVVRRKALLLQRIAFFDTARALFQYWHVIHVPFTIIMFLILAVHVVLTVSLGYSWVF